MKIKNLGFTLIELLVVVLIIGILAGVATPLYQQAVEKARLTELIQMVSAYKNQPKCIIWRTGSIQEIRSPWK